MRRSSRCSSAGPKKQVADRLGDPAGALPGSDFLPRVLEDGRLSGVGPTGLLANVSSRKRAPAGAARCGLLGHLKRVVVGGTDGVSRGPKVAWVSVAEGEEDDDVQPRMPGGRDREMHRCNMGR